MPQMRRQKEKNQIKVREKRIRNITDEKTLREESFATDEKALS